MTLDVVTQQHHVVEHIEIFVPKAEHENKERIFKLIKRKRK